MRQLQRLFKGRGRQQLKPLAQIIAGLFKGGAPGAWYDPSDINLNWRYNLLTYTEQFDNAAWVKFNTTGNQTEVTANAATAPDGTLTADKVRATTTPNAFLGVAQSSGSAVATTLTLSAYVKPDGMNYVTALVQNGTTDATAGGFVRFDLTNNTAPASGAFGAGYVYIASSATVKQSENGFLRISATFTVPLGGAAFGVFCPSKVLAATSTAVTVGDGIIIWGASLTTAANASLPYQQIVTPEISYLNYQAQPILYQDSAGTTPVTAVEQPVGLMLDKSKGLVLGPELVTNGDFSSGTTGWTGASSGLIAVASGVATVTNGAALSGRATSPLATVIGKTYVLSAGIVTGNNGQSAAVGVSNNSEGTSAFATRFGAGSFVFTASATTTYVALYVNTLVSGNSALFDNISVRELPGNHAFQSTAASRPVLSARYNLLTKTEQFDDAGWGKERIASVTQNATAAPDGSITAELLLEDATFGRHNVSQLASSLVSGGAYTFSCFAKDNGGGFVSLSSNSGGSYFSAVFNLSTGLVQTSAASGVGWSVVSTSIASLENGWYRCSVTGIMAAPSLSCAVAMSSLGTIGAFGMELYAGSSRSIYIWGASLVPANQADLPYQRVNTATDYNTVGFLPYLKFDGVDDSLSTNSINFTSTDKMSVFAGVRKLSDATDGVLTELSATVSTNDGSFAVLAPYSSTTNRLGFALRGSAARTNQITGSSPYEAPTTLVLAVRYDTAGTTSATEILPRVNGVVPSTSTAGAADSGTGNFGNYPLYIGRRGGSTVPFNGQLYSMIIVGKAVQAGELTSAEKYVNSKTKAY